MGTWKLNEKKSKLAAGTVKNTMVVSESMLGKVRCTVEGTDANGKPIHSEWTGRFDGKDYPVTGYPDSDACSVYKGQRLDDGLYDQEPRESHRHRPHCSGA